MKNNSGNIYEGMTTRFSELPLQTRKDIICCTAFGDVNAVFLAWYRKMVRYDKTNGWF